jgi:hypothetical protein
VYLVGNLLHGGLCGCLPVFLFSVFPSSWLGRVTGFGVRDLEDCLFCIIVGPCERFCWAFALVEVRSVVGCYLLVVKSLA